MPDRDQAAGAAIERSWQSSGNVEVVSVALPATTLAIASRSLTELISGLSPESIGMCVAAGQVELMSVPIARTFAKVASFRFDRAVEKESEATPGNIAVDGLIAKSESDEIKAATAIAQTAPSPATDAKKTVTRIKPPRDVVKLEDRLFYVLQPPLETQLAGSSLEFPFVPFPYQFEGVAFLYPRIAAVLADEMGLGKTMQAITAIRLLLHSRQIERVLLVCPKPLVTNWQREFALWAPEVPLTAIEGDQAKRQWQWQLPDVPVKIANYELLNRDRRMIADPAMRFDLVVLDESQRIKNRNGATSQVVRSISRTRSWALTGTPVENSPEDLVGIFEFVAPGHLSSDMKPRSMGRAASDFVLRRTKDKVLADLPPKLFRDADLELTPEQRYSYQLAEDEGVLRLAEMGRSATIQHVFELIVRLKQICNFDPATSESAKLERLDADLEEIATSGKKAIVFSQWVGTLSALSRQLRRFGTLEYHGQIPSKKRDAIINQFRDDPRRRVLLMSYGAGGVGLNLQFAEYVFLFDRWWNPAVEDQAINRAHRIGAAGPVTVSRFLMLDTIEQRIHEILEEKRALFDTIFSDAMPQAHLGLTQQEIFGLFKLRSPHGPIRMAA
ncbi:MAG TPA: DEAD/DEAH box helicase [Pirellulales bacterium]|jgi:SNF2 family DNA or RNA helicase|nr:DEAD/DEAH box helicase [Pirellulales bacterium]